MHRNVSRISSIAAAAGDRSAYWARVGWLETVNMLGTPDDEAKG